MIKFPKILRKVSAEITNITELDSLVETGRFDEIIEPEMMRVSESERWWEYGPNAAIFAKNWKEEVLNSIRKDLTRIEG